MNEFAEDAPGETVNHFLNKDIVLVNLEESSFPVVLRKVARLIQGRDPVANWFLFRSQQRIWQSNSFRNNW